MAFKDIEHSESYAYASCTDPWMTAREVHHATYAQT